MQYDNPETHLQQGPKVRQLPPNADGAWLTKQIRSTTDALQSATQNE
jgi:hypothetical protein